MSTPLPLPDLTFNQTTPSSAIGGIARAGSGNASTGAFFSAPSASDLNLGVSAGGNPLLLIGAAALVLVLILKGKK